MKDKQLAVRSEDEEATKIELRSCGLGTMRTSGTYIGALLQLERNHWYAVGVLVEAAKTVGITKEEIVDYFDRVTCGGCGMADSPLNPCECHEVRGCE
jgi:hypothetical protein